MTLAPVLPSRGQFLQKALGSLGEEGTCFFDSALASPLQNLYVLAQNPVAMLTGNLFSEPDRNLLRRHLGELRDKTAPPPGKQPGAGLYGRVGYEGDFIFGVYPSVEVVHADLGIGFQPVGDDFLPVRALPSTMDQNVYRDAVAAALDYIAAGDVYQVNLARSFVAELPDSVDENWWARSFYERLRAISPAPYAGFMRMGGQLVLSSSPECFLQIQDRDIITRPIKGTRPRLESLGQDLQMQEALLRSGKERAELLMITDLQRNDLGRSCEFGSISVPEMARVETFSHVHHLVATIGGKLRADIDHVEALWAAFPGGSITGAPKKRAREIIAELESGPRGLYTGSMGWFGAHGMSRFNIAIRTAVVEKRQLQFHTGAGIVADSEPAAEARETAHKARGLFDAAGANWTEDV